MTDTSPSTPSALAATAAHLSPSSSTPSTSSRTAAALCSPNARPAVHRLATYGTLQPGCPNHHKLAHLGGRWIRGEVRGTLVQEGWGAEMGFPAIRLATDGYEENEGEGTVKLWVLESEKLEDEWARLDGFEGDEYERVVVRVKTDEGELEACIYAHKAV